MKKANPFYLTKEWKAKRQEILELQHYECQECKRQGRVTTIADSILDVDHIIPYKERPDLALDNDNLQVLCRT